MKKNLAKRLLALVLMVCVFAPQSAFAVTRNYLEVTIEEANAPKYSVTGTSGYLTGSESLTAEVVTVINANYRKNDSSTKLWNFRSQTMKDILDAGLEAYGKGKTNWNTWVEADYKNNTDIKNSNSAAAALDLKAKLIDLDTKVNALTANTSYQISFTPTNVTGSDRAKGNTYTVTVTLKSTGSGSSSALVAPEVSGTSKLLNSDDHIAFMAGYTDNSFRPNASISRAEVAQIFYNLLRDQNVEITASFVDVAEDAWYAKAVNTLASLGVISGMGDQKYEPSRAITRAEFTAIAAKFANAVDGSASFTDVPASHWAYQSIATAASYGWVSGMGNNTFAPDRSITRAEAATIVNHMLGRLGDHDKIDAGAGKRFTDVSESHWAWYEIAEATTAHTYSFDSDRTAESWK